MYYEKLKKLYLQSDISKEFDISLLDYFDDFLRDEIEHNYQYFNPYKFALDYDFSMEDSIKIFLTFTDESKILKAETFVDCSNCPGKRLPFNDTILLENDNYILCEECGSDYEKDELIKNLYVYFKLNDNIIIPVKEKQADKHDPNSTYDLLQRMDSHLKGGSPSTEYNHRTSQVEGDLQSAATLQDVKAHNEDSEGNPRSKSILKLEQGLMNSLFDSVKYNA